MVMTASELCFPEPDAHHLGRVRHAADRMDWLRQSGHGRAVALRRFLNANMQALGAAAAASLCPRFARAWDKTAYFELVVGRFLQLAGASVEYEPAIIGVEERVDYAATFGATVAFVEATSPAFNQDAADRVRHREPLLDILVEETPDGWRVDVVDLPEQGPDDNLHDFRRAVRALFGDLGRRPAVEGTTEISSRLPNGRIVLRARRGGDSTAYPLGSWPGAAFRDDTHRKLQLAVRRKRRQARAYAPHGPVLLALDSEATWGTSISDFDAALFGSPSPTSFLANGALATQQHAEFAGVLAFVDLGFTSSSDPVIYLHPRFQGDLPPELMVLEFRELGPDGIRATPATGNPILARLPFIAVEDWAAM